MLTSVFVTPLDILLPSYKIIIIVKADFSVHVTFASKDFKTKHNAQVRH